MNRGRLSYLTPDRTKPITARKLGDDFARAAVLAGGLGGGALLGVAVHTGLHQRADRRIRTDLMAGNETWVSPDFGDTTLTDRYNQIAQMVKEKTGRAMQTKDRERVNKKTGKVSIVRGSTPLKEGVVVIKEDTTMEQLQHFCEVCKERWGITALQIFIHRDEGL